MPIIFSLADFEVLCHATESRDKVIEAVKNLIPVELHSLANIKEDKLEGHYHNPITKINIILEGNTEVGLTLSLIFNGMIAEEKEDLLRRLSDYIDDAGILYLRLNKQKAYDKKIALKYDTGDVIRLKVKLLKKKSVSKREVLEAYSSLISGINLSNC